MFLDIFCQNRALLRGSHLQQFRAGRGPQAAHLWRIVGGSVGDFMAKA